MHTKKSLIVVPYRDREKHLMEFKDHMQDHFAHMHICVIEQADGKPFNRGKLLNIGFLENQEYDRYIFHDVDMLPIKVNYDAGATTPIAQLASSAIQQKDYLGGVTKFTKEAFIRSGGYHNEYFHRAEDNEMFFNIKRSRITLKEFPQLFKSLPHPRKGPEFDPTLWELAQQKRVIQNQLQVCEYHISHLSIEYNFKHLIAVI